MDFNFKEAYILENDVVQLIPLQLSDYDNLITFQLMNLIYGNLTQMVQTVQKT